MKLHHAIRFAVILVLLTACATTRKEIPANAFIISGKMNPALGGKVLNADPCWVMEAGKDLREVKYYQFIGDGDLLNRLYEEDMFAEVRVVARPDVKTSCSIGTVVELIEIIEARSKKN